jgi:hypothetical protein
MYYALVLLTREQHASVDATKGIYYRAIAAALRITMPYACMRSDATC